MPPAQLHEADEEEAVVFDHLPIGGSRTLSLSLLHGQQKGAATEFHGFSPRSGWSSVQGSRPSSEGGAPCAEGAQDGDFASFTQFLQWDAASRVHTPSEGNGAGTPKLEEVLRPGRTSRGSSSTAMPLGPRAGSAGRIPSSACSSLFSLAESEEAAEQSAITALVDACIRTDMEAAERALTPSLVGLRKFSVATIAESEVLDPADDIAVAACTGACSHALEESSARGKASSWAGTRCSSAVSAASSGVSHLLGDLAAETLARDIDQALEIFEDSLAQGSAVQEEACEAPNQEDVENLDDSYDELALDFVTEACDSSISLLTEKPTDEKTLTFPKVIEESEDYEDLDQTLVKPFATLRPGALAAHLHAAAQALSSPPISPIPHREDLAGSGSAELLKELSEDPKKLEESKSFVEVTPPPPHRFAGLLLDQSSGTSDSLSYSVSDTSSSTKCTELSTLQSPFQHASFAQLGSQLSGLGGFSAIKEVEVEVTAVPPLPQLQPPFETPQEQPKVVEPLAEPKNAAVAVADEAKMDSEQSPPKTTPPARTKSTVREADAKAAPAAKAQKRGPSREPESKSRTPSSPPKPRAAEVKAPPKRTEAPKSRPSSRDAGKGGSSEHGSQVPKKRPESASSSSSGKVRAKPKPRPAEKEEEAPQRRPSVPKAPRPKDREVPQVVVDLVKMYCSSLVSQARQQLAPTSQAAPEEHLQVPEQEPSPQNTPSEAERQAHRDAVIAELDKRDRLDNKKLCRLILRKWAQTASTLALKRETIAELEALRQERDKMADFMSKGRRRSEKPQEAEPQEQTPEPAVLRPWEEADKLKGANRAGMLLKHYNSVGRDRGMAGVERCLWADGIKYSRAQPKREHVCAHAPIQPARTPDRVTPPAQPHPQCLPRRSEAQVASQPLLPRHSLKEVYAAPQLPVLVRKEAWRSQASSEALERERSSLEAPVSLPELRGPVSLSKAEPLTQQLLQAATVIYGPSIVLAKQEVEASRQAAEASRQAAEAARQRRASRTVEKSSSLPQINNRRATVVA